MKNISIIGTVGIPANYGGFETLVEQLVANLHEKYRITVFCSSRKYNEKLPMYNGAHLKYINLNANGIQSIFYDIISIFKSIKFADTLLILGVSGCIILPIIKIFSKKRIIVNIDGLEWKRNKWNRLIQFFLKFSEKIAVKYANVIVGDNKVIVDYIKSEYSKNSELIAYGSDHAIRETLSSDIKILYPILNDRYAFKVCRIEPENNIHLILEAFSDFNKLNLIIIGNWENSLYGINLKKKYSFKKNIIMLDPIYDQKILNELRSNSYLYIHGHSAGGTNPSLVEAMFLELPIIAYNVLYNKETTEYKAIYFSSASELLNILSEITDNKLKNIGLQMKEIANDKYTWINISEKYSLLF